MIKITFPELTVLSVLLLAAVIPGLVIVPAVSAYDYCCTVGTPPEFWDVCPTFAGNITNSTGVYNLTLPVSTSTLCSGFGGEIAASSTTDMRWHVMTEGGSPPGRDADRSFNTYNQWFTFEPGDLGMYPPVITSQTYCNVSYSGYAYFWYVSDITATPVCSFTATPTYGDSPLLVTFTDTSTNTPNIWNWTIYKNSTGGLVMSSAINTWQNYINGANEYFDIQLTATNTYGSCTIFSPKYIHTTNTSTLFTFLDVKDGNTGAYISGATGGIYNGTDNSWYNYTLASGMFSFIGTGASQKYPLSIGQDVMFGASAPGYKSASLDGAYSGYYNTVLNSNYQLQTIYLIPEYSTPATGKFNLVVEVMKNNPEHADKWGSLALQGATVRVDAPAPDTPQIKYTDSAGLAQFYNITPGSVSVQVSDTWYQSQTKIITGIADTTQFVNFSMVMLGETPVATTVVPTRTSTGGTVVTTQTLYPFQTATVNETGFWAQPIATLRFLGANQNEINWLLALFVIFVCTLVGGAGSMLISGGYGSFSPIGAQIGALLGFSFCIAAGLLPLWFIIATIILICLYAALKLWL